jgi:hypothetical protein
MMATSYKKLALLPACPLAKLIEAQAYRRHLREKHSEEDLLVLYKHDLEEQ